VPPERHSALVLFGSPTVDVFCAKIGRAERVYRRLYRLYDSMSHSRYVASRLGIWKEAGQFKLDHLLAKMGIPLVRQTLPPAHSDDTVHEYL